MMEKRDLLRRFVSCAATRKIMAATTQNKSGTKGSAFLLLIFTHTKTDDDDNVQAPLQNEAAPMPTATWVHTVFTHLGPKAAATALVAIFLLLCFGAFVLLSLLTAAPSI
jgi:hypothetical protein